MEMSLGIKNWQKKRLQRICPKEELKSFDVFINP